MSRATSLLQLVEKYPLGIPDIDLPANNKDMVALYDYINRKYFKGGLPRPRIKFAALAKNFHGKTHVVFNPEKGIKDLLITMASLNKNNKDHLINTMAHEMIHVFQYSEYSKTNDKKYLDDTYSFFSTGDVNTRGHGATFHRMANQLNSDGFEITVSSGIAPMTSLEKEMYTVVFDLVADKDVVIYLLSANDPTSKIKDIIAEIEKVMGSGFYSKYVISRTKDSQAVAATRLTKQFKLPKNVHNIRFRKNLVYDIVNGPLTKKIKEVELSADDLASANSSGVPNSVVRILQQLHKYRNGELSSYFKTTIYNTQEYKHLFRMVGTGISDAKAYPEHDISQETADYIIKDWKDITDAEIKRSDRVKHLVADFVRALPKVADADLDSLVSTRRYISQFMSDDFSRYFADRVAMPRFKKLCRQAFFTVLKAQAKKFRNSYGRFESDKKFTDGLYSKIVKGTPLA